MSGQTQQGTSTDMEPPRSLVGQALAMGKAAFGAVMRDGTIKAAGRQGVDEIGQALKAFPDSIQASELGTIFSPTAADIADDRAQYQPGQSPVGQALDAGRQGDGGQAMGGQSRGRSM